VNYERNEKASVACCSLLFGFFDHYEQERKRSFREAMEDSPSTRKRDKCLDIGTKQEFPFQLS